MTPETRNVEWRGSWRDEYLAWICGFANARGGVLEVGKDADGGIVGVRNVLSLLEDIPSKVRSLLGIVVEVNLKSESGLEYIEIVVEPHSNPISYRGKFHYRNGSTKHVLEGAALTASCSKSTGRRGTTWLWRASSWASSTAGQGREVPLPQAARGRRDPAGRFIQNRALGGTVTAVGELEAQPDP